MFKCWMRSELRIVNVYAVDFNHDAFLINYDDKFRWKPMDDFMPIYEDENK